MRVPAEPHDASNKTVGPTNCQKICIREGNHSRELRRLRRLIRVICAIRGLKHVLQCELHDPRIVRSSDDSKRTAVESGAWVHWAEAVQEIEGFGAEFQPLVFVELKCSRQGGVEPPFSDATNVIPAHIPHRAHGGNSECRRIEELRHWPGGLVRIWIDENLICALTADAVQRAIGTRGNGQVTSCCMPIDPG